MFLLQSNVFNSVFAESLKDTTRAICKSVGTPADQQTRWLAWVLQGLQGIEVLVKEKKKKKKKKKISKEVKVKL